MDYIKDLLTGKQDQEHIHQRFVKYGKGLYTGPSIHIKDAGGVIKINGSHEYADSVAGLILKNVSGRVKAAGCIYSKNEVKTQLSQKTQKKTGLYIVELKTEDADIKDLADLYMKNKEAVFYIDLEVEKAKLKTKKKPPKPGSDQDDEFFTATLDASLRNAVMEDLCFDCSRRDWKDVKITHIYAIKSLDVPAELRSDPAKARIAAKRVGVVKRRIEVDGMVFDFEKPLNV